MSNDFCWDQDDVKEWLDSVAREMLPKMKDAVLSIALYSGKVDPKLCVEIGAAILFDKPIILVVTDQVQLPRNLERAAAEIVRGNPNMESTKRKLVDAISRVVPHEA
jgi:hypothetical protein